jgi:hypothetical protein
MGEFPRRPCPGCGATQLAPGAVASRPSALELSFEDLRPHWRGFFAQRVYFPYGRCAACGQLYCPAYFGAEQLAALYADMPDNTAGVDQASLRRTQDRYAATLRRSAPAAGDYLEVGPDIGLFAEAAVAGRDDATLYLFEPNKAVWPDLMRRFGAGRCRLSDAMDDYAAVPDATIGMAAMVHVLDHALEPIALLRSVAAKLAPGGVLAIVTHDEASLMARLLGSHWLPYCLQHPQLYRPETIIGAVAAAGLEVVELGKTRNDFPLAYLAKHGLAAAGLPHRWVPAARRPTLALKLGNLIAVARQAGDAAPARN